MGKQIELPIMTTVSPWENPQYEEQLVDVDCIDQVLPEHETGKTRIMMKDGKVKYVNTPPEHVQAAYRRALKEGEQS